jgi:hypothetical protein
MDNVKQLNCIQTQVAKVFTNIELLISLENQVDDIRKILKKAIDKGDKEVEKRSQILIMNIEKSIEDIIKTTYFIKHRKVNKRVLM